MYGSKRSKRLWNPRCTPPCIRSKAAPRMPELGLRLALGATPTSLISLVVGQGLRLAAAGVILGMLTGCAAATAMSKLLFGVKPLDDVRSCWDAVGVRGTGGKLRAG